MAYVPMAYVVMARVAVAYVVMAYIVMAPVCQRRRTLALPCTRCGSTIRRLSGMIRPGYCRGSCPFCTAASATVRRRACTDIRATNGVPMLRRDTIYKL